MRRRWINWTRPKLSRRDLGILSSAVIISAVFLFGVLVEYREIRKTPAHSWSQEVQGDCGVVLTGGAGRVREGLDLLVRGSIRKLIISGVNPLAQWEQIFPQWPLYLDLSMDDIVLERKSLTTFGNAQQSLLLAQQLGCQSLVLITSQTHLRRAQATFLEDSKLPIYGRAVRNASAEDDALEIFVEAVKYVFYDLWAF
jgi:uncharacterized SAM-binding protein YcdF (DUF218 family)